MLRKLEVSVEDGGHRVLFVLTPRQILRVQYMSHPGLNTRALAAAYRSTKREHICQCMNLADSLVRGVVGHVSSMISREVSENEYREIVALWRLATIHKIGARAK